MYKLLIADDEHHIVNWLENLFEEQTDLDLEIYKCYSGTEALHIIDTLKIDVILLDIKMPGYSGLEVADKTMENWPNCRIIFLTGHSNFEYIYHVNKHTNVTYLLKTEDDEEIIRSVTAAIHAIDHERKNVEIINESQAKEKILQHLLERNLLNDILKGKPYQEVQNMMQWYNQEFPFSLNESVYLLYVQLKSQRSSKFISDDRKNIIKLMHLTEQLLNNKFQFSLLDLDNSTLLWFLQPNHSQFENNLQPLQYLKECLDDFVTAFKNNFSLDTVFILYSKSVSWDYVSPVFKLLNQYATSLAPGHTPNSFGMLFGDKEEATLLQQNKESFQTSNMKKLMSELNTHLYQGESERFHVALKELISYSAKVPSMHYLPMIEIYQTLSLMFTSYICLYNLSEKLAIQIGIYPLYYINDFANWNEAFAYMVQLAQVIFNLISNEQLDNTQKLMVTITNYINNHISEPLTLTIISESVNYNSSYISRLFKQKMGTNFSEYITHARMEKAKELLQTTSKTIEMISREVGFDNSKYFFLVFKKAFGTSPKEYRGLNKPM